MTIKERDELLDDAERWYTDTEGVTGTHWRILRRIILALPVEAEPPQPKPSMSQAVLEMVRAADRVVNQWKSPYPSEGRHSNDYIDKLAASATAVRDLFVEDQE